MLIQFVVKWNQLPAYLLLWRSDSTSSSVSRSQMPPSMQNRRSFCVLLCTKYWRIAAPDIVPYALHPSTLHITFSPWWTRGVKSKGLCWSHGCGNKNADDFPISKSTAVRESRFCIFDGCNRASMISSFCQRHSQEVAQPGYVFEL
jgi:hypothetical protein